MPSQLSFDAALYRLEMDLLIQAAKDRLLACHPEHVIYTAAIWTDPNSATSAVSFDKLSNSQRFSADLPQSRGIHAAVAFVLGAMCVPLLKSSLIPTSLASFTAATTVHPVRRANLSCHAFQLRTFANCSKMGATNFGPTRQCLDARLW